MSFRDLSNGCLLPGWLQLERHTGDDISRWPPALDTVDGYGWLGTRGAMAGRLQARLRHRHLSRGQGDGACLSPELPLEHVHPHHGSPGTGAVIHADGISAQRSLVLAVS